jgi:hypothetical protein
VGRVRAAGLYKEVPPGAIAGSRTVAWSSPRVQSPGPGQVDPWKDYIGSHYQVVWANQAWGLWAKRQSGALPPARSASHSLRSPSAYSGVLDNKFVSFDGNVYVTEHAQVLKGLSADTAAWAFTTTDIRTGTR